MASPPVNLGVRHRVEKISIFSLERHEGPYEKWPRRTRLFVKGEPSRTTVPGYTLLHQFLTEYGYLLVTDYDCPFEEATNFILLDQTSLKVLSCRRLSAPYGSFLLESFEWINSWSAKITFYQDDHWLLTLNLKGFPFLPLRMHVQRIQSPEAAAARIRQGIIGATLIVLSRAIYITLYPKGFSFLPLRIDVQRIQSPEAVAARIRKGIICIIGETLIVLSLIIFIIWALP
jgi:hypothetical protein